MDGFKNWLYEGLALVITCTIVMGGIYLLSLIIDCIASNW